MNSSFEISYFKKLSGVNYVLLTLFISLSIISHLIAFRLVKVGDFTVFPSSFTYMMCFIIVDIISSYNSKKFILLALSLEAVMNFLMLVITGIVIKLPCPDYLHNPEFFTAVFTPIQSLFFANLLGSFIAFSIDSAIFYYMYKVKKYSFLISSITSSFFIIIIYTIITDYYAFKDFYTEHLNELIVTNIITNLLSVIVYAILSRYLVASIFKYLNNK